jgi:glycosyltransferase involved in cell wall biosynthesis
LEEGDSLVEQEAGCSTVRIILTHNNYAVQGGAEVFYHEVGRVLRTQGHHVAYFSATNDAAETPWRDYFPSVVLYSEGGLFAKTIKFPHMVYNRKAKQKMARLIEDFKPDIIHAFAIYVQLTPSILDAAREAGVPVVMSCNDYKHICPNYKLYHHGKICEECKGGKFYRATANRCCHDSIAYSVASTVEAYAHNWMNIYNKNVHTFLFASEFMAHKTEAFWGKENFRWRMLRNPFGAHKHAASNEAGNYALYFGRLIEEKGVDVLLDAAALARDVPLVVVGDGPDMDKLKKQAASQGLTHVQFVGTKWGDDLDKILRGCRFVTVPSLWHENFPYVILQSFAMGKPVIGSNRGGIPELVAHGERGLVYEATDARALARFNSQLWNDKPATLRMGHAAKRYVDETFNDNNFYNNLMNIYREVLA